MDKFPRKSMPKSSGSTGESRLKLHENKTGVKNFASEETDAKVNRDSPKLPRRSSGAELINKRRTWPQPAQTANINLDSSVKTKSIEIETISIDNEKNLMRSSERNNIENIALVAAVSDDVEIFEEKSIVIVDEINEPTNLEKNGVKEDKENVQEEGIKPQETLDKPDETISQPPKNLPEPKKQEIISPIQARQKVNVHPFNKKPKDKPVKNIRTSQGQIKLQNLVNLVMWEDAARSAFAFGIGTFLAISLSYTDALNFSLISAISYMGLVYLAARFIYNSLAPKAEHTDGEDTVLGEDEAARVIRFVIPFINEFLLNTKALFSGDPATTMKMSVILFLLAKCGSSITIWALFKIGFFGVFTLPKFYSKYSTLLTAHGLFWFQRFHDVWDGCSHKKAVSFAAFALVWNFTSSIARVWALFMMFVAFRYYKQSVVGWDEGTVGGGNCVKYGSPYDRKKLFVA